MINMGKLAKDFINSKYANLEEQVDKLSPNERYRLILEVDAIAEKASFIAAYIGERYGYGCGDQGHDRALKVANRERRKIRKIMGYGITHDIKI